MPRPPILPLVLALLLTACGGSPDEAAEIGHMQARLANMQASLAAAGGAEPAAPTPPASPALPAPVEPRRVAAPPEPARPRPTDAIATVPDAPRLLDPAPPAPLHQGQAPRTAAHLLGQTPDHVMLWLGEPALRRAEGSGAEIWLYAAEACALDLILYRDRAGRLRVGFAAARAAEGIEPATEAECLRRIAGGPAARPAT